MLKILSIKHRCLQFETHLIYSGPPDAASDVTWQHQPVSDIPQAGYRDVFIGLQRWIWSKRADEKCVSPDVKKSMFSNEQQTAAIKDKALNLMAYESSCLISSLLMHICFLVRLHTWLIFILNRTTPAWTQAFHFLKWKTTGVYVHAPAVRQSRHTHRRLHEWSWGRAGERF